jgi:hypothetical protein
MSSHQERMERARGLTGLDAARVIRQERLERQRELMAEELNQPGQKILTIDPPPPSAA